MSVVAEVLISGFTLLLPLEGGDTVASVTERAVQECRSFHLRHCAPKRVLYAKDAQGRILSGSLPFPLALTLTHTSTHSHTPTHTPTHTHTASPQASQSTQSPQQQCRMEIVMEDFSERDALSPEAVERQYRDWQCWTIAQLRAHVEQLVFRDSPLSPSAAVLRFLRELAHTPGEAVQREVLGVLRLLLGKSSERAVVVESAESISRLFAKTRSVEVAVQALHCFQTLNPLQLKLFDSSRYIRAMIDVHRHLSRFQGQEERRRLFAAFESLLALSDDAELKTVFYQSSANESVAVRSGDREGEGEREGERPQWVQRLQDSDEEERGVGEENETNGLHKERGRRNNNENDGNSHGNGNNNNINKRWNVGRLRSLCLSEDEKIRRYGLEKIKKYLSTARSEWEQQQRRAKQGKDSSLSQKENRERTRLKSPIKDVEVKREKANEDPLAGEGGEDVRDSNDHGGSPLASARLSARNAERDKQETSPPRGSSRRSSLISLKADEQKEKEMNVMLFKDEEEVQTLVETLFLALKGCIKAKVPQQNTTSSTTTKLKTSRRSRGEERREEALEGVDEREAVSAADKPKREPASHTAGNFLSKQSLSTMSLAGRLIATALQSPATDRPAIALCVECLHSIFHWPGEDVPRGGISRSARIRNRKINPLTATHLSRVQIVFICTAREFYRLLFTLSHCDEVSPMDPQLVMIAEHCAEFFAHTIVHGMRQGWAASALQLEVASLSRFLLSKTPTHRLYMSLTYLVHLAMLSNNNSAASTLVNVHGERDQSEAETVKRLRVLTGLASSAAVTTSAITADGKAHNKKDQHNKLDSPPSIQAVFLEILTCNRCSLLKSLWWWSVGEQGNFLVRRLALKAIAQASMMSEVSAVLWTLDPIPKLLELMTQSFRRRSHRFRLTFLQRERNLRESDDSDSDEDSYYGDSDEEEAEDFNDPEDSHDSAQSEEDVAGADKEIKADIKLIRLILKTIVNLVGSSSITNFSLANRRQLVDYIDELLVGESVTVKDLLEKDHVIEAYYLLLLEQVNVVDL